MTQYRPAATPNRVIAVVVVLSPFNATPAIIGYGVIAIPGVGRQVRNLIFNRLKGGIAGYCGKLSGHLPLPQPQVLRHATQMTIAAVLTFVAAWAFALPEGYWAVISAVVVMQSSLGGTLGASLDRLMATVTGAMVGAACVTLRGLAPMPEVVAMTLAVGPTVLLAALRPSFRLAPVTAVIVLVGASPGAARLTAFHRVMQIALGCVVGVPTAHLVLPDRAIKTAAASGKCFSVGAIPPAALSECVRPAFCTVPLTKTPRTGCGQHRQGPAPSLHPGHVRG